MSSDDESEVDAVFDNGDAILAQKDIKIRNLEAELKEKNETIDKFIAETVKLNEALRKVSFQSASEIGYNEPITNNVEPVKFDYTFEETTISDFRFKLGELALELGNNSLNIFIKRV